MGRRRKEVEPPCDPSTIVVGDTVTAERFPRRTKYNKALLVTGRVRQIIDGGFDLTCNDGCHSVRISDVIRVRKPKVEGTA